MKPRDSQRSAVYAAEAKVRVGERKFLTMAEVACFVHYVTHLPLWDRLSRHYAGRPGPRRIKLHDGGGRRNAAACFYRKKVFLPVWARTPRTIVHELAHLIVPSRRWEAHGQAFCRAYLELVFAAVGLEPAMALRDAFAAGGVLH